MNTLNWTQWLTENTPAAVYLMVNAQVTPGPVEILYAHDWIEDAFRIYSGTPLAHIAEQSPWLIRLKAASYPAFGRLADSGTLSDPSWGWAYRSNLTLQDNLDHWRRRQIVILKENTVILRLADSRIAAVLLPAMNKDDWRLLMTPVQSLMINMPEVNLFQSPATGTDMPLPEIQQLPFELKSHLISAWQSSPQALIFYADNIACELWEDRPGAALQLDTPEGALMQRLDIWLREQLTHLTDLNYLTHEDFIRHAEYQGWIPGAEGATA